MMLGSRKMRFFCEAEKNGTLDIYNAYGVGSSNGYNASTLIDTVTFFYQIRVIDELG